MLYIDGLRGVASLAVAILHLTIGGGFEMTLRAVLPAAAIAVLSHGYLGVEIFFVISGFVIAYSIRGRTITGRYLGNFAVRRSLRLDPPYYVTIALALIVIWISNQLMTDRTAEMPGWTTVLAHMFYLQGFLGMTNIVGVFWTLCLEVQFYLVLTVCVGLCQFIVRKTGDKPAVRTAAYTTVFGALAITSFAMALDFIPVFVRGIFLTDWYLFFAGALLWWVLQKSVPAWVFWIYCLGPVWVSVHHHDLDGVFGSLTAISIFAAARFSYMNVWLSDRFIQFFGRISYSLYLLHIVIGQRVVNLGRRFSGDNLLPGLFWILLGLAASVAAAWLMYHYIERPGIAWGKRLSKKNPPAPAKTTSPAMAAASGTP